MQQRLTFERAIKAFNSEWEYRELAPSTDGCGNFYRTYYIFGGRMPRLDECKAIAEYLGFRYANGFFYEKIN